MNSISILGAGPAGLSAAYYLKKPYSIWEKNNEVGGGCRTKKIEGFSFDYGGHIFYVQSEEIKLLINKLMGNRLRFLPREAWIYSQETYTRYPFQANLFGLPVEVVKECILGLMKAQLQYGEELDRFDSFEDFVYKVFGTGIAKHFMVPFNLKQWATPLKNMTTDWMGKFIPRPSLEDVLDGSLAMAPRCIGVNANFFYPQKGGIQAIFNAFTPYVENLSLNSEVTSISYKKKSFEINGRQKQSYDKLISTLPLVELLKIFDSPPPEILEASKKLKWNSLYIVNVGIDRPSISDKHRVYYPEEDFIFHKVGYYQNQSPSMVPPGKSAVSAEISFSKTRAISRDTLVEKTVKDLIRARVLLPEDKILLIHVLTLPYAYVIYDHEREKTLSFIKEFLEKKDIYLCGRYAQWEYQNMEQNILTGRAIANKLNKKSVSKTYDSNV